MIRRGLASSSFEFREHLSTKAPYAHRVPIPGAPSLLDLPDPPGHQPTLLWAVARHGSRWPTAKRLQQMSSLQAVFKAADASRHPWMLDWSAPMAGFEYLAGELHATGEAEMFSLAERLRRRFPQLSSARPYAPRRFPVIATQVPRTAQSASAFALGFFARHGDTSTRDGPRQQQQRGETQSSRGSRDGSRPWLPQSVAVNMLPRRQDPVLRPFDSCPSYRQHEDRAMRWLAPWMQQHWRSMAPDLEQRLGLPPRSLTACHVDALWQLCTFEAGLGLRGSTTTSSSSSSSSSSSNRTSSVCDLFSREQVLLLEWLEDVRLNEVQGYGAAINYEITAPLLADAASALASAAAAAAAGRAPLQLARLHFAHAETLAPFAALLGLFRPAADSAEAQHMPRLPDEAALRTLTAGVHSTRVEADWAAADSAADDLLPVIMAADDTAADPRALGVDPAAAGVDSAAAVEAESAAAVEGVSAADDFAHSGGQWDATGVSEHLPMAAAGAGDFWDRGQREQQQQQRQRTVGTSHSRQPVGQQEAAASQLRKRRRLTASRPGSTAAAGAAAAANGGLDDTAVAAAVSAAARGSSTASDEAERSVAGQLQDSSSSGSSGSGSSSSSSSVASKHSHGPALEGCSYKGRPLDPGLLLPPPQGWQSALGADREWRGGRVAPLGANLLLVLYSRIDKGGAGADSGDKHLVRLVYNEQVVSVPGCRPAAGGTGYEVTLAEFLRVAVGSKADGRRFRRHCGGGGNDGGGGLELLTADGLSIVLPDGAAGDDGSDGGSSSDLFRQWF